MQMLQCMALAAASAPVAQNTLETPSLAAAQLHLHQETLAARTLVVPMQMLQCEEHIAFASAAQDTLEIPSRAAAQNVSSTQTVPGHLPVEETTYATTLALEHAASTLSARWSTTSQRAPACQDTSETLSLAAVKSVSTACLLPLDV